MTVKTPPELLDDRDLRHIRRYLKVTSSEIADLAGKDPSAVTHWRKGKKGFPEPVVGGRSPLFRYDEAHNWLKEHNKLAHEPDPAWLWRKSVQALHESTGVEDRSRLRGYVTTMVVVVPDFTDDLDDFVELRETEGFDRWRDETGRDLDTETEKFLGQHINDVKPHGETLKCAARALRYALRKQCAEWELLDYALNALDALSPVQTTTSLPVADLITELIGNLAGPAGAVADLACGEATLITGLLKRELLSDARFVGVEKDRDTAAIARIRLMLHGSSTTADIQVGDSLAENSTPGPFDTVVIDPPTKKTKAWLDLACKNLATNQTSRAFVLLPRSALVADGPCASLIKERRLEAVVSLPNRLKKDSRGLALCVITSESVRCEETLLIDLADRKVKNPYSGPVTQPPDPSPDALSVRDVCTAISQWRDTRTIDDELLPGRQWPIRSSEAIQRGIDPAARRNPDLVQAKVARWRRDQRTVLGRLPLAISALVESSLVANATVINIEVEFSTSPNGEYVPKVTIADNTDGLTHHELIVIERPGPLEDSPNLLSELFSIFEHLSVVWTPGSEVTVKVAELDFEALARSRGGGYTIKWGPDSKWSDLFGKTRETLSELSGQVTDHGMLVTLDKFHPQSESGLSRRLRSQAGQLTLIEDLRAFLEQRFSGVDGVIVAVNGDPVSTGRTENMDLSENPRRSLDELRNIKRDISTARWQTTNNARVIERADQTT